MNKIAENEWRRLFLIQGLPEPLTPASAHLQIFDNYIENTRLRLRAVRDPSSREWNTSLQQHFTVDGLITKLSEIHLDKNEYAVFEQFEGREVRKNRYFHEFDGVMIAFDVYLGPLWGLNIAKAEFSEKASRDAFAPPPFAVYDITGDGFFAGSGLVERTFADVQRHAVGLTAIRVTTDE